MESGSHQNIEAKVCHSRFPGSFKRYLKHYGTNGIYLNYMNTTYTYCSIIYIHIICVCCFHIIPSPEMDYQMKHNPHNRPHQISILASPRLGAFSTDLVEVGPVIPQGPVGNIALAGNYNKKSGLPRGRYCNTSTIYKSLGWLIFRFILNHTQNIYNYLQIIAVDLDNFGDLWLEYSLLILGCR